MPRPRPRRVARPVDDLALTQAALRGAAAGLLGGAAVLALSWLVQRGVVSTDDTVDDEWERLIRNAARTAGISLTASQGRVARVAAQLTYSALLGAIYGVTRTRRAFPVALRAVLNSGLVHAASVPAVAQAMSGRMPRRKRRQKGLSLPLGTAALYGMTTSAAFSALERT
jgi:hypothetical protein